LVIATHVHQDHISGFGECAADFGRFSVKQVWMPWTEDPGDQTAAKLKKKRLALIGSLESHFASLQGPRFDAARAALANLASNDTAMRQLRSGFPGAKVRYWDAGKDVADAAGVAGLQARILGPPRGEEFLSKMDPPAGQRYLRASRHGPEFANAIQPFPEEWRRGKGAKGPSLNAKDEKQLEEMGSESQEALAFALDRAINNTSLVVLFEFAGRHLLFPGDAQYGNWQSWIESDQAAQILAGVDFLKVAHHGSENATPKSALEEMDEKKLAAMISTQDTPWPSIPYAKLVDALERKTRRRLVRSDSIAIAGAPKGPAAGDLPRGFKEGDFWYDYFLNVE
jgi:beta-lactamase superfamily II metal-dependent hydrolase